MNALLLHPASPTSFWSFHKICELNGRKTLTPPLGLITVAALLPANWQLRLLDLNTRPQGPIDWDWADLVMISGMLIQRQGVLDLIREAKSRGKTVVVGGPYATSLPHEVVAAGADFVVRGEAENSLPPFLEALAAGATQGVFASPDRPGMPASPIPRFDLLNFNDYDTLSIQTSRGCPFDCEFCDVVSLYGRQPRYKTPPQVLAELETLHRLGWTGSIFICDDNFIGNKTHARAILEELIPWSKNHGEPFVFLTQASVNLGQDLPMIDLMTEANFNMVFVGIETPDAEVLSSTGKFQNIRNPLVESLNNLKANGLMVIGSFILGFDGEKPGAGERIAALVEETSLPVVMLNLLEPLPNTRLWERLQQEGRLRLDNRNCGEFKLQLSYQPERPAADISAEYLQLWDRLYRPEVFFRRACAYILDMRPTRSAMQAAGGNTKKRGGGKKRSLAEKLHIAAMFCRLSWWQGGRSPQRGQYWQQFFQIRRSNPSRLIRYFQLCAMGEDMFALRRHLLAGQGR